MTRDELQIRLMRFVLRAFRLVEALPKNTIGRAIGGQLARSAPSSAANYRAACRARSSAEFSLRLGTVLEEIDESTFWLELVIAANLLPSEKVKALLDEASELTAIFSSSYATARRTRDAHASSSPKSSNHQVIKSSNDGVIKSSTTKETP